MGRQRLSRSLPYRVRRTTQDFFLGITIGGMRIRLLILATIIQVILGAATAVALVPRIRLVEAVTVFASAFGAGASMVGGLMEIRKARQSA